MFLRHLKICSFAIYISSFFSVIFGTVYFQEEFSDSDKWQERWILSEHPSKKWGFFILSAGKFYGDPEINKGIQTFQDGMHYGLSTKFPSFSNKGKTLVIQYTIKNNQKLRCGGGYIKLFNCSLKPIELNEKTPYLLMFGPDQCIPDTFKTHVILNYKGKYLELQKQVFHNPNAFTHLFTLVINPDNTYILKIDNKDMASGKLKEDWNFLPPEQLVDYKAKKPKDWDDNPTIEDPNDVKPEDWDQPEYLPDLTIHRPDDWDNNIDGGWESPLVENEEFKGRWQARRIPNPKYKGPWIAPKMKNPKYFDDPELYKFDEICGVGFDIWQAESGSIFDNILITDDVDYAEEHSWKTRGSLRDAEKEMAMKLRDEGNVPKHIHDEL